MRFKYREIRAGFNVVSVLLAIIILFLCNSCSSKSPDPMIKIETPGDLYYLGSVIGEDSTNVGLSQTQVNVSENTINDLKDGKADAVLLGTEPTAAELKGINEYEIALDAVCIIIDENSYQGGQYLVNGEAT